MSNQSDKQALDKIVSDLKERDPEGVASIQSMTAKFIESGHGGSAVCSAVMNLAMQSDGFRKLIGKENETDNG